MMKHIVLLSTLVYFGFCQTESTNTVINLKCGLNKETKTNDIVMYSFNKQIEEGQIEFSGRVYDMNSDVLVFLIRGNGDKSDLRKDNSLFIRAHKKDNWTHFDSKKMDGGWYREFSIDGNLFRPDEQNKLRITILKDRYEIWSNGKHIWTASRMGDEGQKIGAAAVVGTFNPNRVQLTCKSTVPQAVREMKTQETEETEEEDED